jgi:hypothetical protein
MDELKPKMIDQPNDELLSKINDLNNTISGLQSKIIE